MSEETNEKQFEKKSVGRPAKRVYLNNSRPEKNKKLKNKRKKINQKKRKKRNKKHRNGLYWIFSERNKICNKSCFKF